MRGIRARGIYGTSHTTTEAGPRAAIANHNYQYHAVDTSPERAIVDHAGFASIYALPSW